jgi:hypothetical protein
MGVGTEGQFRSFFAFARGFETAQRRRARFAETYPKISQSQIAEILSKSLVGVEDEVRAFRGRTV